MSARSIVARVLAGLVSVLLSGGAGYRLATADWSGATPTGAVAATAVVLAAVTVVASLLTHPWYGPLGVVVAFALGAAPPLFLEDSLWLVALVILTVPAAVLVTLVTLLVLGARALAARARPGRHPDGRGDA